MWPLPVETTWTVGLPGCGRRVNFKPENFCPIVEGEKKISVVGWRFPGERDAENGSLVWLRFYNSATVFEDDFAGDKETDTRSPIAFGGAEESESFACLFFSMPGPLSDISK